MQEHLRKIASELLGNPVSTITLISDAGKSHVYKVQSNNKHYALKHYPANDTTTHDRMQSEVAALRLMEQHGINSIPHIIASNNEAAILNWIDGTLPNIPTKADIDDAAVFIGTLHHISTHILPSDVAPAPDACISGIAITNQMEQRVGALMPHTKENPELMKFLSGKFLPTFRDRMLAAKRAIPEFAEPLPQAQQTLIAADFGFHNMIRGNDQNLYFIDFEFFGWDDPCKLMADFLLHPYTPLDAMLQKHFYQHMLSIYGNGLEKRFMAYYPLFGLRWVTILLNDFLPEYWQIRQTLNPTADWNSIKAEQLVKAEAMLEGSKALNV